MLISVLRTYLRPYRGALLAIVGLQLVGTIASLYLPSLNARIIDQGIARGDTGYIVRTGGWMLGVSLVQIVCTIAAVYLGARTAMAFGRDVRSDLFARVGDVLGARGEPVRCALADHPQHQRRAAGADARADDLHDDDRRAHHVRRRHRHGAARGRRAVVADGGGDPGAGGGHRVDRAADGAGLPPDAEADRRGQPRAARADHRCAGGAGVRARAARDRAVRARQHRPHRRRPARGPADDPHLPHGHADPERLERRGAVVRRSPGRRGRHAGRAR